MCETRPCGSPSDSLPEAHPAPGEALTEPDWSRHTDIERGGGMLAAISNAMVGLKKQYFGKGPEEGADLHQRQLRLLCPSKLPDAQ